MTRIAIVVGGLPPEVKGGTEVATERIASHLGSRGHEVLVLAPSERTRGPEQRSGFTAHFFPALRRHYLRQLCAYRRVAWSVLKRYRPDIAQGHILSMSGVLAVWAGGKLGVPSVVYARGSEDTGLSEDGGPLPFYKQFLMRWAGRRADAALVQTAYMKEQTAPFLGSGARILPNGIDAADRPSQPREQLREKLGYGDDSIILSVANFRPLKNLHDLLTAFAAVGARDTAARLILIGDGPERSRLTALATSLGVSDRVEFKGPLPHAAVMEHMAAADALALVSDREGYPNVLNEAFCVGLPVVVSNAGSLAEIVQHEENGLVAPLHDKDAIAAALQRILQDDALRRRIIENNLELARTRTWDWVAAQLESLYEKLLRKRRR